MPNGYPISNLFNVVGEGAGDTCTVQATFTLQTQLRRGDAINLAAYLVLAAGVSAEEFSQAVGRIADHRRYIDEVAQVSPGDYAEIAGAKEAKAP